MYKVIFNTAAAAIKNSRRDWERQLIDDFIRAIHRKEFDCNDDEALADRLGFIAGIPHNIGVYSEMQNDDTNYVALQSKRYDERRLPIAMYGIPQGYVSIEKIISELKQKPQLYILPFRRFYDIRHPNFFKGCYVEIIKVQ